MAAYQFSFITIQRKTTKSLVGLQLAADRVAGISSWELRHVASYLFDPIVGSGLVPRSGRRNRATRALPTETLLSPQNGDEPYKNPETARNESVFAHTGARNV